MCTAVLLDTVSIQRYIFGSNKLKENIGASRLIQWICVDPLRKTLQKIFPEIPENLCKDIFKDWEKEVPLYSILKPETPFEVGYIGGGNALLFFQDPGEAKAFVTQWTQRLLVEAPGIITAVSIKDMDDTDFWNEKNKQSLFDGLSKNKCKFIPQTIIPRHGVTALCQRSGYSQEVLYSNPEPTEPRYVSCVTASKLAAAKEANTQLAEDFRKILKDDFVFTDELDRLGQSKGEDSHIAIVHIDGNDMGQRFMGTVSLQETRSLSKQIREITKATFTSLLKTIVAQETALAASLGLKDNSFPQNGNGKRVLPLRPIIIGGDDVTFVAEGRLGLYFAELFLKEFEEQSGTIAPPLSACAGVAITKTKYPFYRGYVLAEQLCGTAKKRRREENRPEDAKENSSGSWIDFHVAYGGFSGDIEEIRQRHYTAPQGKLCLRPYKINDSGEYGFNALVQNKKQLMSNLSPKIKEMRQVLYESESRTQEFLATLKTRGTPIDVIFEDLQDYRQNLWKDKKTPFFDMIEILDFYPDLEESK